MALKDPIAAELAHESISTRKMLERVPEQSFNWQPHEKSMKLGRLALHIAEINAWLTMGLNSEGFDVSTLQNKPVVPASSEDLLQQFDEILKVAQDALATASDELLMGKWKLRNGEMVIFEMPRLNVIRTMVLSHIIHHRGQLSVYLRLLNVPVPGMYGPSADER